MYVVVDLETTGLSKEIHRITEIAAARVEEGKITGEFHSLVNPEVSIPRFITRLTGIDNEMVKDAPTINAVMPQVAKFIGKDIFVAHNAAFDFGFLNLNSIRHLNTALNNDVLCTRRLANRLLPELPSKRLGNLCSHFNVTNSQAHRAMADVHATAAVFNNLLLMLNDKGIQNVEDILKFQKSTALARLQMLNR